MKRVLVIALAGLLGLGVGAAWAEEISGKIQSVDVNERTVVLEDGSTIWLAEGVSMENIVQGKNVKAAFEEREGKKVATSVEVSD